MIFGDETIERLLHLGNLEVGWDPNYPDSVPPTRAALLGACAVIPGVGEDPWFISPVVDGGLAPEWRTGGREYYAVACSDGSFAYFSCPRAGKGTVEEINPIDRKDLIERIRGRK